VGRPLVSPSGGLDGEAPVAERGDDQATRTERHQPVEIEVPSPLGALDDVVDLEGSLGNNLLMWPQWRLLA
jgi:hypothetical protein